MLPRVYEGILKEKTYRGRDFFLVMEMPSEPEGLLPIGMAFWRYLDRKVRITLEEKKITIEDIEE